VLSTKYTVHDQGGEFEITEGFEHIASQLLLLVSYYCFITAVQCRPAYFDSALYIAVSML
jgi:hypothetical protein